MAKRRRAARFSKYGQFAAHEAICLLPWPEDADFLYVVVRNRHSDEVASAALQVINDEVLEPKPIRLKPQEQRSYQVARNGSLTLRVSARFSHHSCSLFVSAQPLPSSQKQSP